MITQNRALTREMIEPKLQTDERILWIGESIQGFSFTYADIILIPIGLLFTLNPVLDILREFTSERLNLPSMLFDIPFIIIGLAASIGRPILNIIWKRYALYTITDKRALVFTVFRGKEFRLGPISLSSPISHDIKIGKYVRKDGSGILTIGKQNDPNQVAFASLIPMLGSLAGNNVAFIDIPDVESAYSIITKIKNKR